MELPQVIDASLVCLVIGAFLFLLGWLAGMMGLGKKGCLVRFGVFMLGWLFLLPYYLATFKEKESQTVLKLGLGAAIFLMAGFGLRADPQILVGVFNGLSKTVEVRAGGASVKIPSGEYKAMVREGDQLVVKLESGKIIEEKKLPKQDCLHNIKGRDALYLVDYSKYFANRPRNPERNKAKIKSLRGKYKLRKLPKERLLLGPDDDLPPSYRGSGKVLKVERLPDNVDDIETFANSRLYNHHLKH